MTERKVGLRTQNIPDDGNPKDSIGRQKSSLSLIPRGPLALLAAVQLVGARKYGEYNWRVSSVCLRTYIEAAQRHLDAFLDGEDLDQETGLPHAAHVMSNMTIILDAIMQGRYIDDRPIPGRGAEMIAALSAVGQHIGNPNSTEVHKTLGAYFNLPAPPIVDFEKALNDAVQARRMPKPELGLVLDKDLFLKDITSSPSSDNIIPPDTLQTKA